MLVKMLLADLALASLAPSLKIGFAAPFEMNPHRLRAFFAEDAKWRWGLDVLDVRDLMRHKRLAQAETYTDVASPNYLTDRMREISEKRALGTTLS